MTYGIECVVLNNFQVWTVGTDEKKEKLSEEVHEVLTSIVVS